MKFQKIMCSVLALGSLVGCAKYNGNDTNKEETKELAPELVVHDTNLMWGGDTPEEFLSDVLDLIKTGGLSALTPCWNYVKTMGCRYALKSLGLEYRSIEERKLDELNDKMDQLQNTLNQGLENVQRTTVSIYHKQMMDTFLKTVKRVASPVTSELAALGDISYKEMQEDYDQETLQNEKVRFYETCKNLKFDIGMNDLWYTAENFATYVTKVTEGDNNIDLFTLYEETYGSNETWTYMMVQPRTQFISYLATVGNGLAVLAQLVAAYEISLLPTGDSNIIAIEKGVGNMLNAVNAMNGYFQKELLKLEDIKTKHDEKHIMVHRTRTSVGGELVITEDEPISSRLMPLSSGYNDYNYISYLHNEGARQATEQGLMQSYIYTLNCNKNNEYYKIVIDDYETLAKATGKSYTEYTIKDYLLDCGFMYKNSERNLFENAKGFYSNIEKTWKSLSGWTYWDYYNYLGVNYYSFEDRESRYEIYDKVHYHKTCGIFDRTEYYEHFNTERFGDYYLAFLDSSSEAFRGEITTTVIEEQYITLDRDFYSRHFKGSGYWGKIYGTTDYLVKAHLM